MSLGRAEKSWTLWAARLLPLVWLSLFFLLPFGLVLRISLSDAAMALPPYRPVFTGFADLLQFLAQLDFETFRTLADDSLYWRSTLYSLRIAALATLGCLIVGFPVAYAMSRAPRRLRGALVVLVILPFWTAFLIRVYAWIGILRPEGLLDMVLAGLGLTSQPLRLLNTEAAVLLGLVYCYLPFMILPIYATLEGLDGRLSEAATDLGASPGVVFRTITVPLAMPGIVAGSFLVFIPAVGEFVIPDILGGPNTLMIGRVLWTEFFSNRDWPVSAAIAVVLLIVLVLPIVLFQRHMQRRAAV